MSKCLVNVQGGTGKHIMATAIMKELKSKYDEVYVTSAYKDIMDACPYVDGSFMFGQSNLYQDIVLDDDCDVLWKDPYDNPKFIKKRCHLFDAWAEEFDISLSAPAMDLSPQLDIMRVPQMSKAIEEADKWVNDKHGDFIIVQFTGGQSPFLFEQQMKNKDKQDIPQYNEYKEPLKRNFHDGQKLVDALREEYKGTAILHYGLKNEPDYKGSEKVILPYLTYRYLAPKAKAIVCIDSSLQHLCAGTGANVIVIWGETKPEHFGYSFFKNVCAKNVKNTQPYFKPLGASPAIVKMPSVDEIVATVNLELPSTSVILDIHK